MPNQPKTPQFGLRVDPELRRAAQAKAHSEGRTLSDVIREFLREYIR